MNIAKYMASYPCGIKASDLEIIHTDRLNIVPLNAGHSSFIYEIINSPGWKEFIGERNVHSIQDAEIYIQNILVNSNVDYLVVIINDSLSPIGLISFIKRDYLEHPDLGFAFLEEHSGYGYAYEASSYMLNYYQKRHNIILAATKSDNKKSIQLLLKLGFIYSHDIIQGEANDQLQVFSFYSN
jgi:[ribosomal protein S5]-alanine N-acetyltransferase